MPYRTAPRVITGPGYSGYRSYYRPYYTFRPRVSLGFGLWAGYPVAYPYYAYPYPYDPYAYDSYGYDSYYGAPVPSGAYGYPAPGYSPGTYPPAPTNQPQGSVGVQPGNASGGLSFDLTPDSAEVFVDGNYMGVIATFSPSAQPLTLTPGRHHVELRAQGYETTMFDVDVVAGQVIPYQGSLQLLRQ